MKDMNGLHLYIINSFRKTALYQMPSETKGGKLKGMKSFSAIEDLLDCSCYITQKEGRDCGKENLWRSTDMYLNRCFKASFSAFAFLPTK